MLWGWCAPWMRTGMKVISAADVESFRRAMWKHWSHRTARWWHRWRHDLPRRCLVCCGQFVSDIAIFVLKRDVKLQLTNCCGQCLLLWLVHSSVDLAATASPSPVFYRQLSSWICLISFFWYSSSTCSRREPFEDKWHGRPCCHSTSGIKACFCLKFTMKY